MPKKLLLADDSITIQKVITITFASEDYALTIVGDGDSAVKKAKELKPDIILADVAMPGKSGYEVCNAVKNDPALKHIPVLLLAGTFEPLDRAEAARVKADGSIVKPFESQELIDKVNDLLAMSAPAPSAATTAIEEAPMELSFSEEGQEIIAAEPAGEEIMLGGEGDFFGFTEDEEPAKTPGESAPQKELTVDAEAGGFMDLEFQEEKLEPQKAAKPGPSRPEPPKPLSKPATAPPPPKVAAPSFAMRETQKPVAAQMVDRAVKQAEEKIAFNAAQRLTGEGGYPKEQVKQSIERVAREVIEEIAWEVVPELAEELIIAEINRFKEAWAKTR